MKKNMLSGSSSVGGTMMASNLDTLTLFIVLTLTYGLHNSAKCFSHYQHNIIFFREIDMHEI